jgi:endonuclease/exonuclease/phosphatase family metal-dependent hydrolase
VDGVRVLTLNLFGRHARWPERRRVLADGLRDLRPDVIAFQEAIVADGYDQVADLLDPGFHVVHQARGLLGDGNHGASIASRWPLAAVHEADLHVTPKTADYPCTTLAAEILAPEPLGPLLLVNHAPSYSPDAELERELQAVAAARFVERLLDGRAHHVILAGDLNAGPEASSVRFLCARQSLGGMSVCYRDAWEAANPDDPGLTFSPRNPLVTHGDWPREPSRRIDYLLVRGAECGPTLDVHRCALAFDEPVHGVWLSDHFGVVADLAVPQPS